MCFCRMGIIYLFICSALLNEIAAMLIYGKTLLKNLLLQTQESFEAESWCIKHLELKIYRVWSNDDPR